MLFPAAQDVSVNVVLRGEPRGWARARIQIIVPRSGAKPFPKFFTDAETQAYKDALAWQAKAAMRGKNKLMSGPLKAEVFAVMGVPVSWSTKKRDAALAGTVRPTGKPDWDNFAKILDAFNGVVWEDDAQVVDGRAVKLYGEEPRLEVRVSELT